VLQVYGCVDGAGAVLEVAMPPVCGIAVGERTLVILRLVFLSCAGILVVEDCDLQQEMARMIVRTKDCEGGKKRQEQSVLERNDERREAKQNFRTWERKYFESRKPGE